MWRYTVDRGRQNEFIDWLRSNEDDMQAHTQPGWSYIGTWMTVGGFGDYSGESRWELDSYAALGEGWGDETAQRILTELLMMTDNVHREAILLRNVSEVSSPPNV